jgi:fatty acid kinase fatty acid binding subunit
MAGTVAVITDPTVCLTADLAGSHDIRVVPLQVVLAGQVHDQTSAADVIDVFTSNDVTAVLRYHAALTTSHPAPRRFASVYAEAAASGARWIATSA